MKCSIQTRDSLFRPKTHQVKHYTCSAGVSILAGNGKEGTGKGRAKFASFMQPSGLCSELDCNLMLCDSQLGEVSIITGLQGVAEFLELLERCTDLLVSTRNTVLWYMYLCPLTSQYEANIKSVADYIKSSVDEVKGITGKNTTNGPMEPYLPRQPPLFKCFLMVSTS